MWLFMLMGRHPKATVRIIVTLFVVMMLGFYAWLVLGIAIHDHRPGDAVGAGLVAGGFTAWQWYRVSQRDWKEWHRKYGAWNGGPSGPNLM